MKVLNTVERRAICQECHTELEYDKKDVWKKMQGTYQGPRCMYKYIVCPECGSELRVRR
jgi:RNase P subunit RPR2